MRASFLNERAGRAKAKDELSETSATVNTNNDYLLLSLLLLFDHGVFFHPPFRNIYYQSS